MSVLSCALLRAYTPRHAAPREPLAPSTRSALAVGLTAALLPLSATGALADDGTGSDSSTTSTSASSTATTSGTDASGPSSADSSADESSSSSAQASSAPAESTAKRSSTLSLTAPRKDADGRVPVKVRLLTDGAGVRDAAVRIERRTSDGWVTAGRVLTGTGGVGRGTFTVPSTSSLRARYAGSTVRTAAVSSASLVTVAGGSSDLRGRNVIAIAARLVGTPYRYGATGPSAFDCSGYTRYVYGKVGKSLPHSSSAQKSYTVPVSKAAARPGDLVFIPGHVGIYAGSGRMYDAPKAGERVKLRKIYTSHYTVGRVK